jgi:CarD family transcriptional regulator
MVKSSTAPASPIKKAAASKAKAPAVAAKAKPAPKVAVKPATKAQVKPAAKPMAKAAVKPAAKASPKTAASKAAAKAKLVEKPVIEKVVPKAASVKAAVERFAAAKATNDAKIEAAKVAAAAAAPVGPKPIVAQPPAPKKSMFKIGEQIVYPAHGVGRVTNIEEQEIAGVKLELYIVDFEKEKLRLKVPTNRAEQKGMRRLADRALVEHAMKVIRGRARIKRTMWSRRAQEYDAKINSGDLIAVAEVVRDLYRSDRQPEQSYSERQLFEQALLRFARELAAVRKVDDDQCVKELEEFLAKNAKRASAAAEKVEDDSAEEAA